MDKPLLVVRQVAVRVGSISVLEEVSLAIQSGRAVAIIGPNGSGKTTLFNLISGFLKPLRGEIFFRDRRIDLLRPAEIAGLGVARTFQDTRVFSNLSIYENLFLALEDRECEGLLFGLNPLRRYRSEVLQGRALDLLKRAQLSVGGSELAADLSRGQRKLVELLRIIALDGEVMLLDEPFAGLFPEQQEITLHLLRDLLQSGKSVVFIEHDMNVVRELASSVLVLHGGKVFAEGTTEEVLGDQRVADLYLNGHEPT